MDCGRAHLECIVSRYRAGILLLPSDCLPNNVLRVYSLSFRSVSLLICIHRILSPSCFHFHWEPFHFNVNSFSFLSFNFLFFKVSFAGTETNVAHRRKWHTIEQEKRAQRAASCLDSANLFKHSANGISVGCLMKREEKAAGKSINSFFLPLFPLRPLATCWKWHN